MLKRSLTLEGCAIDVWHASFAGERAAVAERLRLLSAPERRRADGYRVHRDRERFITSRGLLRVRLGAYLGCDAASVPVTADANGKPAASGTQFNVAHAGDVIVLVFAGRPLGVDVEWLGRRFDPARLSARCLTASERHLWQQVDPARQREAFLRLWVRKEACVKASGVGLRLPLGQIDVTDNIAEYAPAGDGCTAWPGVTWHVGDVAIEPDYIAAIALLTAQRRAV